MDKSLFVFNRRKILSNMLDNLTNALVSTTETVEVVSEDVENADEIITIIEEEPTTDEILVDETIVENAEEYFKKALEQDANLIKAKYNLALIYESNNRDKAKELYIEVLETDINY